MTSRKKRIYRLPPEERPSDAPLEPKAQPPAIPEPAANADEPEGESTPSGAEFYFPPLKGDGSEEFTPLPGPVKHREPIQLPGPGTSRRRKRPNRPIIIRPDASELGQRFESMAYRAAPTFDFFLFSLLAGAILGIGYLFDAPAVLLLGIIVAPVLTPWVGAVLAAVTGEIAFLKQTIGGFLTGLVMIILTGLLAGFISRIFFAPISTTQLQLHGQLLFFDLLLVAIGTVALTLAFVQSEEKPLLTSLMVAYEFYLPASAAGFALGSGLDAIWPQALLVLLVHLAISIVLALIVFYYMGFRPLETSGYLVLGSIIVVSLALVVAIVAWGTNPRGGQASGTPVGPKTTPVTVVVRPTLTETKTPSPTVEELTPTPSETSGPTAIPTPVYGRVGNRGAFLLDEPGGTAITTLDKGYLVEFVPGTETNLEGTTFVRVKVKTSTRDMTGWVRTDFIVTATPAPATQEGGNPTVSPSSTVTETPTVGPSPTSTATYEATGSYSVVNITKFDAALNVRTAAGITNPLAGSFAYTMTDIGKLGPPVTVGNAEWWQVRKAGGVTGWVNSAYLTEYIPSATFCADSKVKNLLSDLSVAIKTANGTALAALVSPKHGLDVRLVANNTPVNYPKESVAGIFDSNAVQNWGPAAGSDAVKVSGTFTDIMQPKLLDVYNASFELSCNDTSKVGPTNQTWPSAYSTINFYSIYKPASGDAKDWRDFLVGIEYVDGQPYLFSLVHAQPVP